MTRKHHTYLASSRVFACRDCKTHLAVIDHLISRQFNGQHGRACLFEMVYNIVEGDPDERDMTTGKHIVRDISCVKCNQVLGWKYDRAFEVSQRYKEGRFILEKNLLCDIDTTYVSLDDLEGPLQVFTGRAASPVPGGSARSA